MQQAIILLAIDVNRVLEKVELLHHDLQHGKQTRAAVQRGQEAISLLQNPQAFIDGIHNYHDEVMDEMAILAEEAKAMLAVIMSPSRNGRCAGAGVWLLLPWRFVG